MRSLSESRRQGTKQERIGGWGRTRRGTSQGRGLELRLETRRCRELEAGGEMAAGIERGGGGGRDKGRMDET